MTPTVQLLSYLQSKMMRAVSISFIETAALVYAEKHFPIKTPMRWQLIAEYVLKCVPVLSKPVSLEAGATTAPIPLLVLGRANANSLTSTRFQCTPEMCRNVFTIISTSYPELLSYAHHQAEVAFSDPSFKPVVLLPNVLNCCGKPIYIKYVIQMDCVNMIYSILTFTGIALHIQLCIQPMVHLSQHASMEDVQCVSHPTTTVSMKQRKVSNISMKSPQQQNFSKVQHRLYSSWSCLSN